MGQSVKTVSQSDPELFEVIADLVTERGRHLESGDLDGAHVAAQVHAEKVGQLFIARKQRGKLVLSRRSKFRTKSFKLAVVVDQQIKAFGYRGLEDLVIDEDELENGVNPSSWRLAGMLSDKGPDCACLKAFLEQVLNLSLDWWLDPCHGGHHSAQHGQDRAGLRMHAFSMTFAYNCGLGEWGDGTRREQVLRSIEDTMQTSGGPHNDPAFMACLSDFTRERPPEDGDISGNYNERLYEAVHRQNAWHQSDTK